MTDLTRFQTKPGGKIFKHGKWIKVETLVSTTKPKRRDHLFAKVYLQPAAKAAKATQNHQLFVWIWLQHLAWDSHSSTFPVPNAALAQYGISRAVKWKALESFEAAGLISIVRHKTKSPVVTLINAAG
jgi:hypothetical protein